MRKFTVFWNMKTCSMLICCQRFRIFCCLLLQGSPTCSLYISLFRNNWIFFGGTFSANTFSPMFQMFVNWKLQSPVFRFVSAYWVRNTYLFTKTYVLWSKEIWRWNNRSNFLIKLYYVYEFNCYKSRCLFIKFCEFKNLIVLPEACLHFACHFTLFLQCRINYSVYSCTL
jgi:hypothetical protein